MTLKMADYRQLLETDFRRTLEQLSDELTRTTTKKLVNLFPDISAAAADDINSDRDPSGRLFQILKHNHDLSSTQVDSLIQNLEFISQRKAARVLKNYKTRNVNLINEEIDRNRTEKHHIRPCSSSPSVKREASGQDNVADSETKSSIFISSSPDAESRVSRLRDEIEQVLGAGSCWMSTAAISAGETHDAEVTKAISGVTIVLCLISLGYADCVNCQKEVLLARQKGKQIVPVLLEEVDWPLKTSDGNDSQLQLAFAQIKHTKLYQQREDYSDSMRELCSRLQQLLQQRNHGAETGLGRCRTAQETPRRKRPSNDYDGHPSVSKVIKMETELV